MKISTRIGDKGKSRLYSGRMLRKSSLVFEVLGSFDELNAAFGLCKSVVRDSRAPTFGRTDRENDPSKVHLAAMSAARQAGQAGRVVTGRQERENNKEEFLKILEILQTDIYRIMAIIGSDFKIPKEIREIDRKDVLILEQFIEKFESEGGDVGKFVMPGESEISARLHLARTACRRAERSLVAYDNEVTLVFGGVPEFILQYVNRVSDLLFLMACF